MTADGLQSQPPLAAAEVAPSDWGTLISAAAVLMRPPVVAQQHIQALPGGSRSQLFRCDDGERYAVKFRGNPHGDGHGLFTEQVVALLGGLIGAPVPDVKLVRVTAELVDPLNIDLGNGNRAEAGLQHGSCFADGFSDRLDLLRYPDKNREAFAALRLLYSWLNASDHQVIYRNAEPHDVLSVDHGHFLPGAPNWSEHSLRAYQGAFAMDANFDRLNLSEDEHASALARLQAVSHDDIAEAAGAAPEEWGVPQVDRVAFAVYAADRRQKLLESFGRTGG